MAAFAQFERELLRERQREGIALAKGEREVQRKETELVPGRKPRSYAVVPLPGNPKAALAREMRIDRKTLYRYLALGRNEEAETTRFELSVRKQQDSCTGFMRDMLHAERQDEERFGGLREDVLRRDDHRCRVCGASGRGKRSIVVHHRKPGVSELALMIALCLGCHAKVHHTKMVIGKTPVKPLLLELWREHTLWARARLLDFPDEKESPTSVRLFED